MPSCEDKPPYCGYPAHPSSDGYGLPPPGTQGSEYPDLSLPLRASPPFPQSVGQEECFPTWISGQPVQRDAPLSVHDQRIFPPYSALHPVLPDEHFSELVLLPGGTAYPAPLLWLPADSEGL